MATDPAACPTCRHVTCACEAFDDLRRLLEDQTTLIQRQDDALERERRRADEAEEGLARVTADVAGLRDDLRKLMDEPE